VKIDPGCIHGFVSRIPPAPDASRCGSTYSEIIPIVPSHVSTN